MQVNWAELTITHEETRDVIYKNAFVTDFEVIETTVEAIVRDGRACWKVENENNNVLTLPWRAVPGRPRATILSIISGMGTNTYLLCCSV
jgi:hypothetical protein